jgi:hypothetical protein
MLDTKIEYKEFGFWVKKVLEKFIIKWMSRKERQKGFGPLE